jgi:hypothetical protein
MLIAGGLLAVGVLAIIGVVLLAMERKPASEAQALTVPPPPSRATIPLQQDEAEESIVPKDGAMESVLPYSETGIEPTSGQFYEIVNQLQQLQRRVEELEHNLEALQVSSPSSFDHYEDQSEAVLHGVPLALHSESHQ